jgi:hypothetical protein
MGMSMEERGQVRDWPCHNPLGSDCLPLSRLLLVVRRLPLNPGLRSPAGVATNGYSPGSSQESHRYY